MVKIAEKTRQSHHRMKSSTRVSKDIKIPTIDVKKYGGQQVAIVDGKIVAQGRTWKDVLQKARARFPDKPLSEIRVFSVPKSIYVIYYA